jgi:hypothetical protein
MISGVFLMGRGGFEPPTYTTDYELDAGAVPWDAVLTASLDVEIAVSIERPPADVWPFVSDAERLPGWPDEFEAVVKESNGPVGRGTVSRIRIWGERAGSSCPAGSAAATSAIYDRPMPFASCDRRSMQQRGVDVVE